MGRRIQAGSLLVALLLAACESTAPGLDAFTAITRTGHERYFPIQAGAHATTDCNGCHGAFDTFQRFECTSCHDHAAEPMALAHVAVGGFSQDSASCLRCHAEAQVARVADHQPFGIAPTKAHHLQKCLDCHAASRTDKPFATEFKQSDCLGCHTRTETDPRHANEPGYAWENPSCLRCHPGGELDGIDHAPFFPIGADTKHKTATCGSCHTDASDRKVVTCTTCHEAAPTADAHPSVGGYVHDSPLCLRCHADSQRDAVSDHAPFRIDTGAPHFQAACLDCHVERRTDKAFGAEFNRSTCLGCHVEAEMAPVHASEAGYTYENANCLRCHESGGIGRPDHQRFFPIDVGSKHATTECVECHTDPAQRKVVTCDTCHEVAPTLAQHPDVGGFAHESPLCLRCHADSQVDRLADHDALRIDPDGAHFQESCLRCHVASRADKAFGADFKQAECLGCHLKPDMDTFHQGFRDYGTTTASCLLCHPKGEQGVLDHSPYFPLGTGTAHVTQGCTECHVDAQDRNIVDCATCHEVAPTAVAHVGVGGFEQVSSACLRCHADSQVDRVADHDPLRVDGNAPHAGESCLQCHTTARTDKPFGAEFKATDCLGCHTQARTDPFHRLEPTYTWANPGCLHCHPAGTVDRDAHAPQFPIGATTGHADVACRTCHTAATDAKVVNCSTCHEVAPTAVQHLPVGGFTHQTASCLRCHVDDQVDRVAAHAPFKVDAGSPHFQESCVRCHPVMRTDKPLGVDFRRTDCLGCHLPSDMNPFHQGFTGYAYANANCQQCHPTGARGTLDHAPFFPLGPGTAHATQSCAQCHTNPANRQAVDCATCHEVTPTATQHAQVGGYAHQSASCLRCHADSQVDPVADHAPLRVDAGSPHFQESCVRCHPAMRTDKPFGANFTSSDCVGCHLATPTNAAHPGFPGYTFTNAGCLHCHPNGVAEPFQHAPFFPIGTGTAHVTATCANCHTNPANAHVVTCTGCHTSTLMTTPHRNVGGYTFTSTACLRCHADSQVDRMARHLPFHITTGEHFRESCLRCHPAMRTDKPFGANFRVTACLGCHAGIHDRQFGEARCLDCHADGTRGTTPLP